MSHSWFIQFHKEFQFIKKECQPPMWFLKWWSKHGSQAEIIPDTLWNSVPPTKRNDPPLSTHTLKQALHQFIKMYKCTEYNSRFPPILLFCVKYKVPQITKWSYQIKDNILIRNFAVIWWDNFDRDRIIKFVFNEFPETKQVEDKPSSSFLDLLKGKSLNLFQFKASTHECLNFYKRRLSNMKFPSILHNYIKLVTMETTSFQFI